MIKVTHCVCVGEEGGIYRLDDGATVFWTEGQTGFDRLGCKGYHKPNNSLAQNIDGAIALDPTLGDNLGDAEMSFVDNWSEVPETALLTDPNTAVSWFYGDGRRLRSDRRLTWPGTQLMTAFGRKF